MSPHRTLSLLLVAIAVGACEHGANAPATGATASARPGPAGPPTTAATAAWSPQLGPVLLVAGDSPNEALVVATAGTGSDTVTEQEARTIRSRAVELLGHGDAVQVGLLQAVMPRSSSSECQPWPMWQVDPAQPAGKPLTAWAVGFAADSAGVVEPIALDSVETLSPGDSAHLAAEVTRLASIVPGGNTGSFQGLPFTVTSMWRFRAAPGVEGIAATLVRQLAEEARPLEERTFLIAERDSTRRDAPYELAFHERSQGTEDTNVSTDLVAAIRLPGSSQPTLVVSRDYGDGTEFAFVERDGPARWHVRWTSRRGRC